MRSSAVRDLMAVADRPDVIAFSGGMPETGIFLPEELKAISAEVLGRDSARSLQYGTSQGLASLRELVCELMADEGMRVHPDDVLITVGAQQALEFIGKVLVDEGDPVIVEEPCYVGALNAFMSYEADFVSVPQDDDGIQVDLLEQRLAAMPVPPKFIYVIPNFQNPSGATMSLERRHRIVEIAKRNNSILIEDNPYGRLRFSGEHLPTLRSMDPNVVYLGTFSKIFSPGVRVGWVVAPPALRDRLLHAKQAADLCSSVLNQRIVEEFFRKGYFPDHLERLIQIYTERSATMLAALKEFFPAESTWSTPTGGFFVWAKLPSYLDTGEMLAEALRNNVAYVPGSGFYTDGRGTDAMRLAFSSVKPDRITEGIEILGQVIKDQMELYESLKF